MLPDTVDDRIIDCIRLCEQRAPNRGQGRNVASEAQTAVHVDDKVGRPCHEPQKYCHESNLEVN